MATAVAGSGVAARRSRLPERLPDLKGKWLTLYAIAWAVMLPLAIIGPTLAAHSVASRTQKPVWLPYGVAIAINAGNLQMASISSEEARRAGVVTGDRIIAIDGWQVPVSPAVNSIARTHAAKAEGASTVFTLKSPEGAVRDVRLTFTRQHIDERYARAGVSFAVAMIIFIASNIVTAGALLVPAIVLFARERRKAVPALLSLGFLMVGAAFTTDGWDDLGVSSTIVVLVAVCGWIAIFAALFGFPAGQLQPRWTRVTLLALPILLVETVALPPSANVVLPSIALFFVAAATALLTRYRRLPSGEERQQLRWAFLGFIAGVALIVIGLVSSVAFRQFSSADFRWDVWSGFFSVLDALACVAIASGLLVSLLRFRLYDADTVIGRSAAYGILTLGFVGLFAGTEKLAELIGERYFEQSIGVAAGAIGAAVAAACIVPLHNRVHRWAERRFQKPLIRLREGLPECVADLRESAPVEKLVSTVLTRVEAGVHSTREAVLLRNDREFKVAGVRGISLQEVRDWQQAWQTHASNHTLDCDRRDTIFPLRIRLCIENGDEPEAVGWLLLGPRPDGSFFGKDEREALQHVAGPVARAMYITQRRQCERAELGEMRARFSRIEEALAQLLSERAPNPPRAL